MVPPAQARERHILDALTAAERAALDVIMKKLLVPARGLRDADDTLASDGILVRFAPESGQETDKLSAITLSVRQLTPFATKSYKFALTRRAAPGQISACEPNRMLIDSAAKVAFNPSRNLGFAPDVVEGVETRHAAQVHAGEGDL
jgi:hypothetical protein